MIGRMIGPPTSPATTSIIMIGSGTGSRTIHQVFFNPDGADAPSVKVGHGFFSGDGNLASNKAGACLP
jgi:hypothetical protein